MRTALLLTGVLLAACGAGTAEPTTQETTPTPSLDEITGPPKPWGEMTFDERKRYMGREVLPVMTELFKSYDPGEFSGFFCDTCHGDDPADRNYAMPSPSLPTLYPTGSPEQEQAVRDHPEMVRFMFNRITPTMQRLLGAPEFDATTGEGFTCFACHPRGESGQ